MAKPMKRTEHVHEVGAAETVSSSSLKNAWHAYLDRVEQTHAEIVVTRYGKPVAKLVPYPDEGGEDRIFGCLAGTVTVHGDLVAPIGEAWEADG